MKTANRCVGVANVDGDVYSLQCSGGLPARHTLGSTGACGYTPVTHSWNPTAAFAAAPLSHIILWCSSSAVRVTACTLFEGWIHLISDRDFEGYMGLSAAS